MRDYSTLSKRDQRLTRAKLARLYGRPDLDDEPDDEAESKPREAKEAAEQARFLDVPEGRGAGKVGELLGKKAKAAGQAPGFPDITIHYPPHALAIEFKAPDKRPRRATEPEWWLAWELPPDWPLRLSEPTRYGLRASQAEKLQTMAACGYRTLVAYDAFEARAWVDATVRLQD